MNNDYRKLLNILEIEHKKDKFKFFNEEELKVLTGIEKYSLMGILGNPLGYLEYNHTCKGWRYKK